MATGLDRWKAREERRNAAAAKKNSPVVTHEVGLEINNEPIVQKSGKSRLL